MGIFFISAFIITLICVLLLIAPLLKRKINHNKAPTSKLFRFITSLFITLFICIGGWLVYFLVGAPTIIEHIKQQTPVAQNGEPIPDINDMLSQLDNHLANNENDLEGWLVKAQVEMSMDNNEGAYTAVKNAYSLINTPPYDQQLSDKEKANIITRYVDTSVVLNNGSFSSELHQLLLTSTQLDEQNPQAHWLLAMSFSQQGQHNEAIEIFQKTKTLLAPFGNTESEINKLDELIAIEQQSLENAPNNQVSATPSTNSADGENLLDQVLKMEAQIQEKKQINANIASIPLRIEISDDSRAKLGQNQFSEGDTVFIIAKAKNGLNAPLAVSKKTIADFPLDISIDASMVMLPNIKLEEYIDDKNIEIIIRASKSGQPQKQDDDIETVSSIDDWYNNPSQRFKLVL